MLLKPKLFSLKNLLIPLLLLVSISLAACSTATAATNPAPTVSAAATADPHAGWPNKFIMGFFAGDDPNKVLNDNEAFRAFLEKRLGIPVQLVTGTSYSAVIEAMRAKHADAMEVGPFSYTLAVQEAGAEALAVSITGDAKNPVYDAKKTPYYYSVIVTKKGSGISTLADLKGKDFTFVDPASTSGHLMPKALLIKNGINPDKDMKTVFAGSHPSSVIAIWNDKAPAGATYEGNIYDMSTQGQVDLCFWPDGQLNKARTPEEIKAVYDACPTGKLAMIAMTDPIPNTPFAVRGDLPQSFKDAVKAALMDVKNDPELIKVINRWYVDPSKDLGLKYLDNFYDPLRDVAKLLDLDLKKMK